MKCPHCNGNIDVRFIKAPPDLNGTARTVASTNNGGNSLVEMLDAIDDSKLTGASQTFVAETRERFAKYKDKTKMSDKQLAWLRKLAYGEAEDEWS